MKSLLSTVSSLSAVLLSFLQPAFANVPFDNLPNEYKPLYSAINGAGVELKFSDSHQTCKGSEGLYLRDKAIILVCSSGFPNWSPNSLDTLRHEAHHVLQDCRAGDGVGGNIGLFFSSIADLQAFIHSSLSMPKIDQIVNSYTAVNTPPRVILLELEAFAAANTVGPLKTAKAISNLCPVK